MCIIKHIIVIRMTNICIATLRENVIRNFLNKRVTCKYNQLIEYMWSGCEEMREREGKERREILSEDGREIGWMKEVWNCHFCSVMFM
jgi:hypothetical protein